MSKLICNYNLNDKQWDLKAEKNDQCYSLNMSFRFFNQFSVIEFSNLSFGYTIKEGDVLIYSDSYPKLNQTYISSDQLELESLTVNITPGKTYSVFVWCVESGVRSESEYTLTTDIPPQPYPSWTWHNSSWNPPILYPTITEGNVYYWNENTKTWDVGVQLIDTSNYEVS